MYTVDMLAFLEYQLKPETGLNVSYYNNSTPRLFWKLFSDQ